MNFVIHHLSIRFILHGSGDYTTLLAHSTWPQRTLGAPWQFLHLAAHDPICLILLTTSGDSATGTYVSTSILAEEHHVSIAPSCLHSDEVSCLASQLGGLAFCCIFRTARVEKRVVSNPRLLCSSCMTGVDCNSHLTAKH